MIDLTSCNQRLTTYIHQNCPASDVAKLIDSGAIQLGDRPSSAISGGSSDITELLQASEPPIDLWLIQDSINEIGLDKTVALLESIANANHWKPLRDDNAAARLLSEVSSPLFAIASGPSGQKLCSFSGFQGWMDSSIDPSMWFRTYEKQFLKIGCCMINDRHKLQPIVSQLNLGLGQCSASIQRYGYVRFYSVRAALVMAASSSLSIGEKLCDRLNIRMQSKRLPRLLRIATGESNVF